MTTGKPGTATTPRGGPSPPAGMAAIRSPPAVRRGWDVRGWFEGMDMLSKEARSERMARVRSKDTKPEMVVPWLVHSLGYRYHLHGLEAVGSPDFTPNPMNDFNPIDDRLKQLRQAETLARLRSATPGAADRLVSDAAREPDPVAVHLGALKKNFPSLGFLHFGWCPDLRDIANLLTLRAHFSARKQPAPPQSDAQFRRGIEELTHYFSRR